MPDNLTEGEWSELFRLRSDSSTRMAEVAALRAEVGRLNKRVEELQAVNRAKAETFPDVPCQTCGKLGGVATSYRAGPGSYGAWACPHCTAEHRAAMAQAEKGTERERLCAALGSPSPATTPPAYYPEITDRELVIRALRRAWDSCLARCDELRQALVMVQGATTPVGTPCTDQGATAKRLREEIERAREGKVPCPGPDEKEPNR